MAMTTRANGGVLMHGAVGLEAAAAKRDDAIAHLWTWGITDVHALGYALHLGRSATYRLVSRGIDRGWWRLMRETGMPTSIIHLTAATAADYRRVMLGHRLADLPARTRPAAIVARKMSHDMATQHAAMRIIRASHPDWVSGENVAETMRQACDDWLYVDADNRWTAAIKSRQIDMPIAVPERIIRNLTMTVGLDLPDVAPVEPDALVFMPSRSADKVIAIETQESNQGLTRNRQRISSYAAALSANHIDRLIIASSSEEIIRQTKNMIGQIGNGDFLRMSYDNQSKMWRGKNARETADDMISQEICNYIDDMKVDGVRAHYYFGRGR